MGLYLYILCFIRLDTTVLISFLCVSFECLLLNYFKCIRPILVMTVLMMTVLYLQRLNIMKSHFDMFLQCFSASV